MSLANLTRKPHSMLKGHYCRIQLRAEGAKESFTMSFDHSSSLQLHRCHRYTNLMHDSILVGCKMQLISCVYLRFFAVAHGPHDRELLNEKS